MRLERERPVIARQPEWVQAVMGYNAWENGKEIILHVSFNLQRGKDEMMDEEKRLRQWIGEILRGERAESEACVDVLWDALTALQGEEFATAKGLTFTYSIRGYEMFVSRKDKSLTKATVALALRNALELQRKGEVVSGPKKLKTFGASYLYPVFIRLGVIRSGVQQEIWELLS